MGEGLDDAVWFCDVGAFLTISNFSFRIVLVLFSLGGRSRSIWRGGKGKKRRDEWYVTYVKGMKARYKGAKPAIKAPDGLML